MPRAEAQSRRERSKGVVKPAWTGMKRRPHFLGGLQIFSFASLSEDILFSQQFLNLVPFLRGPSFPERDGREADSILKMK
jgi:hypothetical protein